MTDGMGHLVSAALRPGREGVRPAARLMSRLADTPERLPDLLQAIAEHACLDTLGPRLLLGVTGAPGAGKSTLTDALVRQVRERHPDRRVGVIAVDPSSPFTGGAVLGDRVRMMRHATDPMVFVRSLASRGHVGGLTQGVKGIVRVMGLIGCDVVVLETVGVGQSEVEIASVADLVAIVLAPGQGDSVQLLKAGLMEIGDLFIVNKADRPDAGRLHTQVLGMLQRAAELPGRGRPSRIRPRAYLTSAETNDGIDELCRDLEALTSEHTACWVARRRQAIDEEILEAVLMETQRRVEQAIGVDRSVPEDVRQVLAGRLSIEAVAQRLLETAAARGPGRGTA